MTINIKMIYLVLMTLAFMFILAITTIKKILSVRSRLYKFLNVCRRNNRNNSTWLHSYFII